MKKLRILMLALLLPAFVMTGCDEGNNENPGGGTVPGGTDEPQIVLSDSSEKSQTAFADEQTADEFTFTAKQAWTATVTDGVATARLSMPGSGVATTTNNVDWLRLLLGGEEAYSGAAGDVTLAIELDVNYSGEPRTATITVKSGDDTIIITVTQDGKTEDGIVPDDNVPVAPARKFVSRIDHDYGDGTGRSSVFEYDSQDRVVKVSSVDYGDTSISNETVSFYYDDAARTVAMTIDKDGEEKNHIFQLDATGAIVSGTAYGEPFTASYKDGYLELLSLNTEESIDYEYFMMTWNGGNMTAISRHWKNEDGLWFGVASNPGYYAPIDLNDPARPHGYEEKPNNPQCNLDLNALIVQIGLGDGIFNGYPELLGLFGKRSQYMIAGVAGWITHIYYDEPPMTVDDFPDFEATASNCTVDYDTDGFVTKITADYLEHDKNKYTHSYSISYR